MLSPNFDTIYLMLGFDCNASCKYCLQKGIQKSLSTEINEDIIDFISSFNNKNFLVTFIGGEPLLYWDKIKYIVQKVHNKKVYSKYRIFTNGLLLDNEKIEFLNKNDFNVSLSWDGINTNQTRSFDIFSMNSKILNIKNLLINSILTKYSYPSDIIDGVIKINEKYKKIHGYNLRMHIEPFCDTGTCNQDSLNNMNYNKLYEEIYNLTTKVLNNNGEDLIYQEFILDKLNKITNGLKYDPVISRGGCKCGWNHLNMDLQGNLYRCHNTIQLVGNINDTLDMYYKKLSQVDTRKRDTRCSDCEVRWLCQGGCKTVPEELEEKYCEVQKAYYIGFYKALEDWGK